MHQNMEGLRSEIKVIIISYYTGYFEDNRNENIAVAGRIAHMKNEDYLLHIKL